jgi:hypothetical protein
LEVRFATKLYTPRIRFWFKHKLGFVKGENLMKRILMPMMVLGVVLALSGVASAQVTCGISGVAISRATATGHTEPAGDVTVTCTAPAGATGTTGTVVSINYGVIITSTTTQPPSAPVRLTNFTGDFNAGNVTFVGGGQGVINASGTVNLNLPAVPGPTLSSSFTLRGILVSLNGTGRTNLFATLGVAGGNNYFINGTADSVEVISSVLPGLTNPVLGTAGTAVWATNGTSPDTTFAVNITENYIDMFRDSTQFNNGNTFPNTLGSDVQLLITFANIPTGANLGGCTAAINPPGAAPSVSATTVDAILPTLIVNFGGTFDLTQIETVTVGCNQLNVGSATLPLASASITAVVTLYPTGAALVGGSVPTQPTNGQIPRYQATNVPSPALTVVTIVPATTTFLIPFATAGGGFDTGIAISNTTADPYGVANGGASPQNGTLTYTFFPVTGNSVSYTTSATSPAGNGGLTGGALNSGRTYSILLSQLLSAAGAPANFNGYIFVVANFTNGHGSAFVTNFAGFTSATSLLVLAPPPALSRQNEVSLGQ